MQNGVALTSAAGAFHIQPTTNPGCLASAGPGICFDDGALATSGDDRNLRYDPQGDNTSVMPELKRLNVYLTGNYDLTENIKAYGEVGYYTATTHAWQSPVYTTSAQVITRRQDQLLEPLRSDHLQRRGQPEPAGRHQRSGRRPQRHAQQLQLRRSRPG
jgi:hypothetical protein